MAMHTATLPIKTNKPEEDAIDRRFDALGHIHNITVKHANGLMTQVRQNKEYQHWQEERRKLKEAGEDAEAEEYANKMNEYRDSIGLTKTGLEKYIKVCAKQFSKLLSSQQIQKEADRVWCGVEKVLFGDGKRVQFKKYADLHTVGAKSNTNGAKFDLATYTIDWNGLELQCKKPETEYLKASLSTGKIKYCEIERKMFPNGWHYYAIIYIDGDAPKVERPVGKDISGLDMGVSTVAAASDNHVTLQELSPRCKKYNKEIAEVQQKMDRSKRESNPENYNEDGTIRKGKKQWIYSKSYRKLERRLKTLYRQKSAYTKCTHQHLANQMLAESNTYYVEKMDFKALAKKSKKTQRQATASTAIGKNGEAKQVFKYKRKRRYGKSINDRSPGLFLDTLTKKCRRYDGDIITVNTQTFKASQYNHDTDTCTKVPLSQRKKTVGGREVQRDLYSAFLLSNPEYDAKKKGYTKPDRDACLNKFGHFADMQDELIAQMRKDGITMKQCFGF